MKYLCLFLLLFCNLITLAQESLFVIDIDYLSETPKQLIIRTYNLDTKVLNDGYYDKTKQSYFSYQPETIPGKPYNFVGIANDLDGGYPFPIFSLNDMLFGRLAVAQ